MDRSEHLHILNLLNNWKYSNGSTDYTTNQSSVDKEMIRAVLQGTYIRTKPGWTRVPWCIIKVMVAMFPNLAPGPGQLTLHWHCVALYRVIHSIQGESWYTGWIMWPPYLVTSSRKWHILPPGVCPAPTPTSAAMHHTLVCVHGANTEKLVNGPALYNPYMIQCYIDTSRQADWINWITKLLVMFSQVKCRYKVYSSNCYTQ